MLTIGTIASATLLVLALAFLLAPALFLHVLVDRNVHSPTAELDAAVAMPSLRWSQA
jgi:hypothetical protein